MTMRKLALLLLLTFSQHVCFSADSDGMPIIAYGGVPYWQTSEENFRVFSECGFNVSLYSYPSLDFLVKACRQADKYGVKVLGSCPEMTSAPYSTARTLRSENGFFGYVMQDEPTDPEIRIRQQEIESLQTIDTTHVFYINLMPYYNEKWVRPSLKVATYGDYLRSASATSCQQISFDHYPVTTEGIRPTWYHNLEMIRNESLASGKPFWGFVLSVPHDVPFTAGTYYPTPTLASLRLQVYSNLAYGAQAIQYFTYWTPPTGDYHYHDAPISFEGRKTATYSLVQQMNRELKTVATLFYGSRVVDIQHSGFFIPEGTTRLTKMPTNIQSLTTTGYSGAVVSEIEKDGHRYLAIVNKSHTQSTKVRIKALNDVPRHLTKSLEPKALRSSYTVPPGDVLLFRLR